MTATHDKLEGMNGWKGSTATMALGWEANTKHGKYGTRVYKAWARMKERCLNRNNHAYPRYGGRGITVCARWMDFAVFYADMGEPGIGMTLERIDNDKGYSPDNCRWATRLEQQQNTSAVLKFEYQGNTYTASQLAEMTDIPRDVVMDRLKRGWAAEDAISKPIGASNRGALKAHLRRQSPTTFQASLCQHGLFKSLCQRCKAA